MIRVLITAQFAADDLGPSESYTECFDVPGTFGGSPADVHAELLRLVTTKRYFEVFTIDGSVIPLNACTVKFFAVWDRPAGVNPLYKRGLPGDQSGGG